jgi:hypothetical protein
VNRDNTGNNIEKKGSFKEVDNYEIIVDQAQPQRSSNTGLINRHAVCRKFIDMPLKDMEKTKKQKYQEYLMRYHDQKKRRVIVFPSLKDFLIMKFCCNCFLRRNKKRYMILQKCLDVVDKNLQVDYLIRKFFEVECLKRMLLTTNQQKLLKFQFRYINFANYEKSMEFLDMLADEEGKMFSNEDAKTEDEKPIDEKLIEGLRDYYNV